MTNSTTSAQIVPTVSDLKIIAGIAFKQPSELKEKLFLAYANTHELGRLDRDTLRQFGKEFGGDTRKLKKAELVELVWAAIESQGRKNEDAARFLLDKTAPVNAVDIALLMDKDLSPQTIKDIILSSMVTYTDCNGNEHRYEASTIIKTYIPKINKILLSFGELGSAVHRLLNDDLEEMRAKVNAITKQNTWSNHQNLIPISEREVNNFIAQTVLKCSNTHINWLDVGLALGLLTGRRQAEIFGTGKFSKVDETHILFSGQLKTKGREDVGSYVIPVINATWVIILLDKLTELGKRDKELSYINKTISTCYARTCTAISKLGLTVYKDSRVAYALYHCNYTKPVEITDTAYCSSLMGHTVGDLTTAQSYEKFRLVP